NRPIAPASPSGTALQLLDLTDNTQLSTTFVVSPSGRELWITPVVPLPQEKHLQVTIQGITDLVGNVMAAPLVTSFYSLDATPPRFGAIAPAAGATYTAGDLVAISVAASDPSGVHDVSIAFGPRAVDLTSATPAGSGVYAVTLAAPRVTAPT